MSSSGSVAFVPLPLLLLVIHATKPRLSNNSQNCISPNPLCPVILAGECLTKWMNPYGPAHLDHLSHQFPIDILICHCLCLATVSSPLPSATTQLVSIVLQRSVMTTVFLNPSICHQSPL